MAVSSLTYVLDTGAFLGRSHPEDGPLLTTEAVLAEVRPAAALRYIEQLRALERLAIVEPSPEAMARVTAKAKETGDAPGLSATDLGLLALAIDNRAILVTSDHRMQNVAKALDLPFSPTTEGAIRRQWRWTQRCTGCRKRFDKNEAPRDNECPICGQPLRSVRAR